MAKNIILLSDGTGNSARALFKTNVWRLYQALDLNGQAKKQHDELNQIAFYDDGVGTSSFKPLAILGGAFGYGLKRNVLDLYTFLCRNYQAGDHIYCFGFSRGAFTARVLAGLICDQGVVQAASEAELQQKVLAAFRMYRRRYHANRSLWNPFNWLGKLWRGLRDTMLHQDYSTTHNHQPPIRFLGVWDTVAAYGLPLDELTRAWDAIFPLSFPNRELNDKVQQACHALALDDERHSFHPELWTEEDQSLHDRLLQVWFAGMHSDVGGSYPDDGLAHVPLDWMMRQAAQAGLRFKPVEAAALRAAANIHGPMHDSRRGLGGFYRYRPRKLAELCHDDEAQVKIRLPKIHESVFERIKAGTAGYAPLVLPAQYAVYYQTDDTSEIHWEENAQEQQAQRGEDGALKAITAPPLLLPESHVQGATRAAKQRRVEDLVWKKRVVYFLTVFVGLLLAFFPLFRPATVTCEGPFCSVSFVIKLLGALLPDMLEMWVDAYATHPGSFLGVALVFFLLLKRGDHYHRGIFEAMRSLWAPIIPKTPLQAVADPGVLAHFREWWRKPSRWIQLKIFVPVVSVVVAGLVLALAARVIFKVGEAGGLVCRGTPHPAPITSEPHAGLLSSKDACWASGGLVAKGKRYQITLTIPENNVWRDETINANLSGFGIEKFSATQKLIFMPVLLLQRHFSEPWFKPMARIGETGQDVYALSPPSGQPPATTQLEAEIVARRDGELFLYLNDAVLPGLKNWQYFYANNQGDATVQIKELPEKESAAKSTAANGL